MKGEFQEQIAKSIKINIFYIYIHKLLKESGEMAEKCNEFFASEFAVESFGHIPHSSGTVSDQESKELSQTETTRDKVLDLLWK